MIRFLAALSTLHCQILRVSRRKLKKKIRGLDFRGTVRFRGGNEISLNCYKSGNICHSGDRFSVLYSPSHALSDDIFGGLKLENFIPRFCDVIKYDILTYFYPGNDQDTYPRQCAKFGKKTCKERKLALNDRF